MKYLSYVVCVILALITTGCFEMLEDIYINQDGTGRYELTVDMSGMFSDPFMGEMMKNGMKEETNREQLEIDSLLSFADLQEGGLPPTLTDQDRAIINRTQMRMIMSESKEVGKIVISFPFESMEELNDFQDVMTQMSEEGGKQSGMGSLLSSGSMTGNASSWELSGRTLNRVVDTGSTEAMMEEMGDEDMDMMKMMMADASFTTTYHLPGKVKKTSIDDAVVDGKTVTVTYGFLDFFEEGVPDMGGTIKFKKN